MSKKHFIALANTIRESTGTTGESAVFNKRQILILADFCSEQNPRFNRERWLAYIAGECGPNGGRVKASKAVSQ